MLTFPLSIVYSFTAHTTHQTHGTYYNIYLAISGDRGSTVVKVLCYKLEVAGVNEFFIDIKSFRSHYSPGVDSASNRNEYQEHFLGLKSGRCVRLTTYHHPVLS